jgi:broad specificity phosphatase PhoE
LQKKSQRILTNPWKKSTIPSGTSIWEERSVSEAETSNEEKVVISDEGEDDLHINMEIGKITPKEIWENKDVWFNQAKESKEAFEHMADEQREALERMVTGALERMHDRIPDWLPEALTVEGGNFIEVRLRFLFTDIDKEIDRNEQATSFQIKAAAEATKNVLSEFEDEDEEATAAA